MIPVKLSTIIIFLGFFTQIAIGGPWPKNTGQGYFKLSEWWVIADEHFTDKGLIDPNVTNGVFSSSIYGEYGLNDKITFTAYFPFFTRSYFNNTVSGTTGELLFPGEAINSIGDTDLGITYGLWKNGKISTAISVVFGLPLGINDGGSLMNLQTGDGEFNQSVYLEMGSSYTLWGQHGWVAGKIGLNNRTKGFSDEWLLGFEVGMSLFNGIIIPNLKVLSRQSLFNGDNNLALNFTSVFSNNVEYIAFTPELIISFKNNWGITLATGRTFQGRIIFADPSYSIGIYYDMK